MCDFCSAEIPNVLPDIRETEIPAEVWAEGLNRRARHAILAGGEPFMYSHFRALIAMLQADLFKVEIYTNLGHPVDGFINAARGRYFFLVSLHPGTNTERWLMRIEALMAAGHAVRIHIVRAEGYEKLVSFIDKAGLVGRFKTALQGDQRNGIKSLGKSTNIQHPLVNCRHRIFLFGPDGHRYHCIHRMMQADPKAQHGHINGMDNDDWTVFTGCTEFGYCAGCDNNIEGRVTDGSSRR
jgi:hypothetical protein